MTTPDNDSIVSGGYCKISDMMMGDIQVGTHINVASYIQRAANEMNLKLASTFKVPMSPAPIPENHVTISFLRDMNAMIATGRLIMSLYANKEGERVHAYANRLIRDANEGIEAAAEGRITLPGLVAVVPTHLGNDPMLFGQQDPVSATEAFYGRVMPYGHGVPVNPYRGW